MVKADAYGVGVAEAVPALWDAGCRTFFVALPEEGVRVRAAAPQATIYVLAGFFADAAEIYRAADLRPVLNRPDDLSRWTAHDGGRPSALHIDTGMNRLGFSQRTAAALARDSLGSRARIGLVMSHLACADEPENPMNAEQLGRFLSIRELWPEVSASLANSAGILLGPQYRFNLVRPGIALYGAAPRPGAALEVVVTAEARILQIRGASRGETVGYGATHRLTRHTRLATLAAGYADGFPRAARVSDPQSLPCVVIAGRRAPILGRVSMDLIVADVTDVPDQAIAAATHAELFGTHLPIDEVAAQRGTIAYELLTGLSRRARRIYVRGAEPS